MKKLSFLFFILCILEVAIGNQALALVPGVETVGSPAITKCPATSDVAQVYHSDKIVFIISGALTAAVAADQAALDALPRNTELDIKIKDTPTRIAHIKAKVLTFLGAIPNAVNAANIKITDVEYTAVVCPKFP